jgi:hypothetical protein
MGGAGRIEVPMRSIVAGATLVLAFASAAAPAQSPQRGAAPAQVRPFCSVPTAYFTRQRNEPIAHGQNTMMMTNSGQPCGRALRVVDRPGTPETPATAIELTLAPANGTIAPPRFDYRPRPGFIGTDRFTVLVPGQFDVTYTVSVVTPDQAR